MNRFLILDHHWTVTVQYPRPAPSSLEAPCQHHNPPPPNAILYYSWIDPKATHRHTFSLIFFKIIVFFFQKYFQSWCPFWDLSVAPEFWFWLFQQWARRVRRHEEEDAMYRGKQTAENLRFVRTYCYSVHTISMQELWCNSVSVKKHQQGVLVLLKLYGTPDFVEFVLGRFSHFYIATAYSNFTFFDAWTPSFCEFTGKMSKFQQNDHIPYINAKH